MDQDTNRQGIDQGCVKKKKKTTIKNGNKKKQYK